MVRFGREEASQKQAVAALMDEVFNDDGSEVLLQQFVGHENQFTASEEGALLAVLSAVPCTLGALPGVYYFALATKPEARGRGLMAGLMATAEEACRQQGAQFLCLFPASASLFGFYERHGFETIFYRRVDFALQPQISPFEVVPLSEEALSPLRRQYLPAPYLSFSKNKEVFLLAAHAAAGWQVAKGENGYLVFRVIKGVLAVAELGARDTAGAERLLSAVCAAEGCEKTAVTLLPQSDLFPGQGKTQPAAQVKLFTPALTKETIYMRFGFDETFENDFGHV